MQSEIVKGAIDLDKDIKEIMISKKEIHSIKLDKKITPKIAKKLGKEGFSRLPVFKNGLPIGILLTKSLIGLELPAQGLSVGDLVRDQKIFLRKPMFCSPETKVITMLKRFKNGRSHLAIVTEDPEKMEACIVSGEVDKEFEEF